MSALPRHKYLVVLGSCCTADAIRTENLEDIRGARLRLLWYQGRTTPLSMRSGRLESGEFAYTEAGEKATKVNWGSTMVGDEVEKRQQGRLAEVIGLSDALIIDTVSVFGFPYLIAQPHNRYFLCSKEWQRYVRLRIPVEQKRLWDFPMELSVCAFQEVLEPLYERQPNLHVIFHLPRPCFNDGVTFDDPETARNVNYYHDFNERLCTETLRRFPRVSVISCGGERADPKHYNGPYPFHFERSYMDALRQEIERLLN